ncbi:MAG: CRISPR-associated protein Csx15 [Thermodesulfobacteriota bacterium]
MILLNFSHPLTNEHLAQVEALAGQKVDRMIEVNSQSDPQQPLVPQVVGMAEQCGLSPTEWQTLPILVSPPSLHWAAVTLLAELHGRCGYFPAHLRLRPVGGKVPTGFEVTEILNLQEVRDRARAGRK